MRPLLCLLAIGPLAATAASAGRPIVAATQVDPASGAIAVELIVTNDAAAPQTIAVADTIDATLAATAGRPMAVRLERAADQPARVALGPSGFARLRYRLSPPPGLGTGLLTLTLPEAPAVAIAYAPPAPAAPQANALAAATPAAPPAPATPAGPLEQPGDRSFLANLSAYEPIYAVYGPGTNSDARLQISFKYQLFGTAGERTSWLDGIMFGYTQRMFWDTGRASAPFRDVDYMPELYYSLPQLASAGDWAFGGRFGARHQSNGRSGEASRSFNIVYVEPELKTRWGDYDVAFGPQLWAYVGRRSDNPDIAHYRGHTGLTARIGTPNGVQLSASGRLNPGSGKGAAEALISYPLPTLFNGAPRLYLFGQGFVGYGENLLDYNRHQTRLRAGLGITR
ncbi:phospholipase A [Sphingomonas sp.]|uniref:phospholipase A n=1 Tax=Sphingomonas sp. TaxID=28214 RepID=UPI003B3A2AB3